MTVSPQIRIVALVGLLLSLGFGGAMKFMGGGAGSPTAVVPALAGDVHDLDGLRRVGVLLGGQDDGTRVATG